MEQRWSTLLFRDVDGDDDGLPWLDCWWIIVLCCVVCRDIVNWHVPHSIICWSSKHIISIIRDYFILFVYGSRYTTVLWSALTPEGLWTVWIVIEELYSRDLGQSLAVIHSKCRANHVSIHSLSRSIETHPTHTRRAEHFRKSHGDQFRIACDYKYWKARDLSNNRTVYC